MRLRKYGVEATIDFTVYEVDGVDLRTDWVPAQADCEVMKDGGASTMCTNTATDEGSTYSIVLTATEMQAARLVLKIVAAATKVFLDHTVVIETYGHPSAQVDMLDGLVLQQTTITISTQTSFTLAAGSADDDAYNGCAIIIQDATTAVQKAFGLISNYTGSSKTVTLAVDPGIYTMATGDIATILATATAPGVWDRLLSGATHNIASSAGRRLRGVQAFGDYANGALWFDSVNGVGGQVDYENATVQNPSNSLTDLMVIAGSLNMVRIQVAPGSTLALGSTDVEGFSVVGEGWTLQLDGQSVSGSYFHGAAVSGIGTGASAPAFDHCDFGATTLPPCHTSYCGLQNTFTMGSAGTYYFDDWHSMIAGTSSPVLDFGAALNASDVNMRNGSGGIEIQNMGKGTGNYSMSLEGQGQLIINANCTADGGGTSTVAIRGCFTVTDGASGAVTLSDEARFEVQAITGGAYALNTDASGNVGILDGAITASVLGADCITEAKIADDAFVAANFATGAFTADAFAANALVEATFANNFLTSGKIASGAFTSQNFASNSLDGAGDWAVAGDLMGLANDAITASKYDELTAFPVASADTGATKIARVGADGDTLETLSDQIDGIEGGTGSGARSVTITVNDGTTVLENASVRVTEGGNTFLGTTNSSGVATFSLDDATYTVTIAKSLYTFTPTTLVVDGTETQTYSMTALSITSPADASLCTVNFVVKLSNTAVSGAICRAKLQGTNIAVDGVVLSNAESSDTTDANGVAELQLVRKDSIVKGSGRYKIWVTISGNTVSSVECDIPNQATAYYEDLLP